jgi:hypothetical protein
LTAEKDHGENPQTQDEKQAEIELELFSGSSRFSLANTTKKGEGIGTVLQPIVITLNPMERRDEFFAFYTNGSRHRVGFR